MGQFRDLLNEAKVSNTNAKKLASMIKKKYNTGKIISVKFVDDKKRPYIVIENNEHTFIVQKDFGKENGYNEDGVSMGIFANTKAEDIDYSNASTQLMGRASNVLASSQSGVGGRTLLDADIATFAGKLFGIDI